MIQGDSFIRQKQTHRHRKQIYDYQRGNEREEFGSHINTLPYIKPITNEDLLQSTGSRNGAEIPRHPARSQILQHEFGSEAWLSEEAVPNNQTTFRYSKPSSGDPVCSYAQLQLTNVTCVSHIRHCGMSTVSMSSRAVALNQGRRDTCQCLETSVCHH